MHPGGSGTYTEYFVRDLIDEGDAGGTVIWQANNDPPGQIHPIPAQQGAEFWVEYG